MIAIASLFSTQYLVSRLRKSSDPFEAAIGNTPVMLMRNGEFIEGALDRTRVSRNDMIAKLREANVLDISTVRAAVLETTGDVSVLHGDRLDEAVLEDVKLADEH